MQYIANTKDAQLGHITTKDKVVYQLGELYKNKYFVSYFNITSTEEGRILHKMFEHQILCKAITLNFDDYGRYPVKSINEGYFSYENLEFLSEICDGYRNEPSIAIVSNDYPLGFYAIDSYKNLIIGKFIIPKNTLYYKNSYGLIVSNTFLFTGTYYEPIINCNLIKIKENYVL